MQCINAKVCDCFECGTDSNLKVAIALGDNDACDGTIEKCTSCVTNVRRYRGCKLLFKVKVYILSEKVYTLHWKYYFCKFYNHSMMPQWEGIGQRQ